MPKYTHPHPNQSPATRVLALLVVEIFLLANLFPPSAFAQSKRFSPSTFLRPTNVERRGAVSDLEAELTDFDETPAAGYGGQQEL